MWPMFHHLCMFSTMLIHISLCEVCECVSINFGLAMCRSWVLGSKESYFRGTIAASIEHVSYMLWICVISLGNASVCRTKVFIMFYDLENIFICHNGVFLFQVAKACFILNTG